MHSRDFLLVMMNLESSQGIDIVYAITQSDVNHLTYNVSLHGLPQKL